MEHTFTVNASTTSGIPSTWEAKVESGATAEVAIPKAFDGPGAGFSPEDFYALALLNCWLATFKVVASKSKFDFEKLEGEATITSGKNEQGLLWIPKIHIKLALSGASDSSKAERLLDMASKHCLILNSVKTEKTWELDLK